MLNLSKRPVYISLLLLLICTLTMSPPTSIDAQAKRGSLTNQERADFKQRKAALTKQRATASREFSRLQRPFDQAKRLYDRTKQTADASQKSLDLKKKNLSDLTNWEREQARASGRQWTPSESLARQTLLVGEAQRRHDGGPAREFAIARDRFTPVNTAYGNAASSLKAANDGLRVRKADKNNARAANLRAAQDAKVAKKNRSQTPSVGATTLVALDFPNRRSSIGAAADLPAPPSGTVLLANSAVARPNPTNAGPPPAVPPRTPPAPIRQVMFKIPASPPTNVAGANRPLPPIPGNVPIVYSALPTDAQRALAAQRAAGN